MWFYYPSEGLLMWYVISILILFFSLTRWANFFSQGGCLQEQSSPSSKQIILAANRIVFAFNHKCDVLSGKAANAKSLMRLKRETIAEPPTKHFTTNAVMQLCKYRGTTCCKNIFDNFWMQNRNIDHDLISLRKRK